MVRQKTMTCLATLKNGVTVSNDKEQLTLTEKLCEPESDEDEPAEEDDDLEDEDEHENFLKRFFWSSHCTVCVYLALFLVLVGSLVALIVISVQIVWPFTRVQGYLNGTCIPTVVTEQTESCMCGAGCSANFRCISIHVSYQGRNKTWHNATIYENESTLGKQCSFYPQCSKSMVQNEGTVKSYERRYGVIGLPINCYFSPSPHNHLAVRLKRFHVYHVVNGVLWSSLVFVMTAVLIGCTVRRRGCDFCEQ